MNRLVPKDEYPKCSMHTISPQMHCHQSPKRLREKYALTVGGAAPAAPYVILSFLFEIVVEFMFLVCALDVICSSSMLVRMISLISAAVVMIYILFIRIKSHSNLLIFPKAPVNAFELRSSTLSSASAPRESGTESLK